MKARGLAPLRHRGFRLLAAGQLASNVGDAFYMVALPWYVLAEHGGALLLGTVLAAYGVPRTVLLAVGGHASDRWRPWTVMMTSDVVRTFAAVALAVAAAAGPARAAVLIPIAAILGAGEGLFLPGSFSIVPVLLPDAELQAGNALASGGTQLATLIGPAIGGALVAALGPAPAFAIDAGSFVISAATLAGVRIVMRSAARGPQEKPAAASQITAASLATAASQVTAGPQEPGTRAAPESPGDARPGTPTIRSMLRSERVLQLVLLVTIAANLGSGASSDVALPALVHGPLHGSAGDFGGLIAAFGAGALLGTVVAGQVRQARRPAIVGTIAFLVEALFLAAVPYLGGLLPAGAAIAAYGMCNGFGNVVMITVFQRWAPPALIGRLTGLLMLASFGVFPVSVALGAIVVHDFGPAPFFPLAAAVLTVAVLAGLSQRIWRDLGAIDLSAGQADAKPVPGTSQPAPNDGRPGIVPTITDKTEYAS